MNHSSIDRIAFIGRTYKEYMNIFSLSDDLLKKGPVLDCAAGPSSFTAEANELGFNVSACDILYGIPSVDLFKRGVTDIDYIFSMFDKDEHLYRWNYYKNKEEVISFRKIALGKFIKDFVRHGRKNRYYESDLLKLPFKNSSFSMVLCSHFLFLYGDRIDINFHINCIKEMVRVSDGEVRLFPLLGLDAKPYDKMDALLSALSEDGINSEVMDVQFEFQAGGNKMLKISTMERSAS